MSKTLIATSTLIGTMIGAGILAIPYVVMKSGFTFGMINMIVIAITILITMLYLGEIALRTKSNHQLIGYAQKYLGKKGKILMSLAFAFGIYAAILAYLIAEGQSLSFLIFGNLQYQFLFGLLFWAFMSLIIYFGIKALEEGEIIGLVIITILIVSVVIISIPHINIQNLSYNNPSDFFVPFGVILFAFLAFSAIPEVERIIGKERSIMKKSIWISHIFVFVVYALFTAVVLGSKGLNTPPLSTLALGPAFVLLGMLTMFTSYLALSIAIMDSFRFDLKKSKRKAWLYTIVIPIVLFLLLALFKQTNFTTVLAIGGVISGGLTAILILFMVKKAKIIGERNPEYQIPYSKILTTILILIFITGAILEIISLFN